MNRDSCLLIAAFSVLLIAFVMETPAPAAEAAYQPRFDQEGWEILFDGKGLDAWDPATVADAWKVNADGELQVVKKGPCLHTRQRYCDFVVELDFKVTSHHRSNSGVFLRVHTPRMPVHTGREIQILDNADYNFPFDDRHACGALYDMVSPSVDANKPVGVWNHYRITANGSLIVVELNGTEIVRADLDRWTEAGKNPDGTKNKYKYAVGSLPREGFLLLQNHGGTPVWFRNIRIKPLTDRKPQYTGKEPIEEVLRKPAAK